MELNRLTGFHFHFIVHAMFKTMVGKGMSLSPLVSNALFSVE
jgi:hypothetical protein